MLSENYVYYPDQLSAEELDSFLEKGWYRMGQSLFTTHYIMLQESIYRVFWLRYNLSALSFSKYQQQLIKRNSQFNLTIKPVRLTDELEDLYTLYKTGITFEPAQSIQHWLYGDQSKNVFDTDIIEIRDHEKLIAAGILDKGNQAIAGIMNFYDPAYKKYSLGKYLMLLKMQYAKAKNMKWYYPGYIVYNHSGFDYKLFPGNTTTEVFVPELEGWKIYDAQLIARYGKGININFNDQDSHTSQ